MYIYSTVFAFDTPKHCCNKVHHVYMYIILSCLLFVVVQYEETDMIVCSVKLTFPIFRMYSYKYIP